MSYNNNFFICFTVLKGEHNIPTCYINNYISNNFSKIACNYNKFEINYNINYKVFYFKETDDFMFISRRILYMTLLNNFDNSIKSCKDVNYQEQILDYSIIYINDYKVVNINNFKNCKKCSNIQLLEEEHITISTVLSVSNFNIKESFPYPSYIKEFTNKSKYEVFRDIDEILINKIIGINYEIEGKDFTVTIKPK